MNIRQQRPREAVYPPDYWAHCKAAADAKVPKLDGPPQSKRYFKGRNPTCHAQCCDCGKQTVVNRIATDRRSKPRCAHCGGPLLVSNAGRERLSDQRDASTVVRHHRVIAHGAVEE